jgi:hypothetical protein
MDLLDLVYKCSHHTPVSQFPLPPPVARQKKGLQSIMFDYGIYVMQVGAK